MAKVYDSREDIKEFVEGIFADHDLERFANIRVLGIDKQKTLFKVAKASATIEHFCKNPEMLICYVNEKLYDRLDVDYRKYLAENAFSGVCYDDEKDKLIVDQPDMAVSSGCYEVYKEKLSESVFAQKVMWETILAEEKAEKEIEKEKKKNKGEQTPME